MKNALRGVILIPIGVVHPDVTEFLSLVLNPLFNVPCSIGHDDIRLEHFLNNDRQQYHATEILRKLTQVTIPAGTHVLGVADVDLYIPILTFVYGEAQLGKTCALMSTHRLHQHFYGLPEDEKLFLERCEKEAVHEIGHTLGLIHCKNFECVMAFSPSVTQIDLKRNIFCPACSRALGIHCLWL